MEEISAGEFLEKSEKMPLVDVRSPAEFASGHIPGAFNLPLFENEERSVVGILYKNKGRQEAIRKGLEIVGPKMTLLVDQAIGLATSNEILVHCWRGGMRSSSIAWLFEAAGLKVYVLKGGYKQYRSYIRNHVLARKQLLVLGGLTGSGKTNILKSLKSSGENVIDLEGLANHRGSAFGGAGLIGQPTTEQFENNLFEEASRIPDNSFIWVEDESRRIGDLFLPDLFHNALRAAPVIAVRISDSERKSILVKEYASQPQEDLLRAVELLRKRVGGLVAQTAIKSIKAGYYGEVVDLLLPYYDQLYGYGLNKRESKSIHSVDLEFLSQQERIQKLKLIRQAMEKDFFLGLTQ